MLTILLKLRRTNTKTSKKVMEREKGKYVFKFGQQLLMKNRYLYIWPLTCFFIQDVTGTMCRVQVRKVVLLSDLWYYSILNDLYMKTIIIRNPLLLKTVCTLETPRYSLCMTIILIRFKLYDLPGARRHIHGRNNEDEPT